MLADKINRASPKVQSALLDVMEGRQVSIDGHRHVLSTPFFVVAMQNPDGQWGAFPLPASPLDRFLMRIFWGYPSAKSGCALLLAGDRRQALARLSTVMGAANLQQLQKQASQITVMPALANYVLALVQAMRKRDVFVPGLSPRAGLAVLAVARAWALLGERGHVLMM